MSRTSGATARLMGTMRTEAFGNTARMNTMNRASGTRGHPQHKLNSRWHGEQERHIVGRSCIGDGSVIGGGTI